MDRLAVKITLLSILLITSACSNNARAPVSSASRDSANARPTTSSYSDPGRLNKGTHRVQKGDTLYSIAWRYGFDYRNVAKWNNVKKPYVIYPGQVIRLRPSLARKAAPLKPGPVTSKKKTATPATPVKKSKDVKVVTKPGKQQGVIKWHWPAAGKIIKSNSPISKKGVDLTGNAGQMIKAAANGDVVYSGSGLLGYGKLIIVKHNETFLSAYAHNEKILVKEGDRVKAGQQIATMGLGNNGKPLLHFEIRKNGKPVNPLKHLPKRHS